MVKIAFEGAPARGREAVLRFGQPAIKHFSAIDISSFLELTGVYGEISVGGSEQGFQFIEGERGIDRESADDSEAHALVNQTIEAGRHRLRIVATHCGEARLLRMSFGNTFYCRGSDLSPHIAS